MTILAVRPALFCSVARPIYGGALHEGWTMKIGSLRTGSFVSIRLVVWLLCLAGPFVSLMRSGENPPEQSSQSPRPQVTAVLHGGERVEGVLERFDDGVYWLLVGNQRRTLNEKDIASIQFHSSAAALQSPEDRVLDELIQQFFNSHRGEKAAAELATHPALIPKLAAFGPRAVRPLLGAFQKRPDNYQAVGEVLKQIGPEAFPLMVECVREDAGRSARFPVEWALEESGVVHAPFVAALLKDKDPRIRQLAMDVLYSWSITSGVVLPKSLDLPLIQIFDDVDQHVRSHGPHILGRIGFKSDLVLPALLRTLEEDAYADLRRASVSALARLGRDLKPSDSDVIRIIDALSRCVTSDADPHIRGYAAFYLGTLDSKSSSVIAVLCQATDDKNEFVRQQAENALKDIQSQTPPNRRRPSKK